MSDIWTSRPRVTLDVTDLGKSHARTDEDLWLFRHLSFGVAAGETLALRGSNGTGKTTLLRICASLIRPDEGTVHHLDDPGTRGAIGYLPQDYAASLLPWMSILENVALPLRLAGVPRRDREESARRLLDDIGFDASLAALTINELSGGQRQKLVLARATIAQPVVLLLDEPFSSLDERSTYALQTWLRGFILQNQIACIFISHNIDQSIYMSNRIITLRGPNKEAEQTAVTLPESRNDTLRTSIEFISIRNYLISADRRAWSGHAQV